MDSGRRTEPAAAEAAPAPEPQEARGCGLGALFVESGPHEDMLLRHVLSFLHLYDIACIGPTVSRAWRRCVEEHCYPQLTEPGREVEVRIRRKRTTTSSCCEVAGEMETEQEQEQEQESDAVALAHVVVPPPSSAISTASGGAQRQGSGGAEEPELFIRRLIGRGSGGGQQQEAAAADDSMRRVVASDVRPISRVCPAVLEGWLREEVMEGSKPLAMHTATTLAAFLPFCCQRCGAPAAEAEAEAETEESAAGGQQQQQEKAEEEEQTEDERCEEERRRRRRKVRFGALQLRPGVRENLSWMTIEDRRQRLQCISCLVLAAGEAGKPTRCSSSIGRSSSRAGWSRGAERLGGRTFLL